MEDMQSSARGKTGEGIADLYQQLIVERARGPLRAGVLEPAHGGAEGDNPFCGDRVQVTVRLAADGSIAEARHRTRGCAICTASADLMAESVEGLRSSAIHSLYERFGAMLQDGGTGAAAGVLDSLGLLAAFQTLHEYRSRIRCATLPWTALLDAMPAAGPGPGRKDT